MLFRPFGIYNVRAIPMHCSCRSNGCGTEFLPPMHRRGLFPVVQLAVGGIGNEAISQELR